MLDYKVDVTYKVDITYKVDVTYTVDVTYKVGLCIVCISGYVSACMCQGHNIIYVHCIRTRIQQKR